MRTVGKTLLGIATLLFLASGWGIALTNRLSIERYAKDLAASQQEVQRLQGKIETIQSWTAQGSWSYGMAPSPGKPTSTAGSSM